MLGAFSIGDWRVDPSLRTLSGVKGERHLEPKHMQVLVLLAEHAGQVVSKERLIQTVWADTFVGDEVLSKAISELRRAVDDDPKAPRYIQTIPKGGYRLVAPVRFDQPHAGVLDASAAKEPSCSATRSVWTWGWLTAGALLLVILVSLTTWLRLAERPAPISMAGPPMHVVPLTTLTGEEGSPTFSPDGEQVAFNWNGEKQDNWDIYVTLVGSPDVRRLTSDTAADTNPAWSPDGRQIAFLRDRPDGPTIQLVSALGGADRKLSDFRGADSIGWSPDGQWLAAGRSGSSDVAGQPRGIYLIPAEGGDARPLLVSAPGVTDSEPKFSPDGRRLAYASCSYDSSASVLRVRGCDIYSRRAERCAYPIGSPRRLTTQRALLISAIAWTRDGRAVVYRAGAWDVTYLWRVDVDGSRPPERIEVAGVGAKTPAIAPTRDRLAFTRLRLTSTSTASTWPGLGSELLVRRSKRWSRVCPGMADGSCLRRSVPVR